MTQNPIPLKSEDEVAWKPSEEALHALQETKPAATRTIQESIKPHYPKWPTSRPGPTTTPPPVGMKPINGMRSEQVAETDYDQAADESAHSLPDGSLKDGTNPAATGQEVAKKHKERL